LPAAGHDLRRGQFKSYLFASRLAKPNLVDLQRDAVLSAQIDDFQLNRGRPTVGTKARGGDAIPLDAKFADSVASRSLR
jgi:hypothetical protein